VASWSEKLLAARSAASDDERRDALHGLALEALGEGWTVELRLAPSVPVERIGERSLVLGPLAFLPTLEATRRFLLGIPDADALRRLLGDASSRPARATSALRDLVRVHGALPEADAKAL